VAIFAMRFGSILGAYTVAVEDAVFALCDQPEVIRIDAPMVAAHVVDDLVLRHLNTRQYQNQSVRQPIDISASKPAVAAAVMRPKPSPAASRIRTVYLCPELLDCPVLPHVTNIVVERAQQPRAWTLFTSQKRRDIRVVHIVQPAPFPDGYGLKVALEEFPKLILGYSRQQI
jgi:hypothetical protein